MAKSSTKITTVAPPKDIDGKVESDPTISYIASSVNYPFLQGDRALPQTIDEAERQFGLSIYDQMATEPIIAGIEKALKILTLADGISIVPAFDAPPDTGATPQQIADYDQSMKIADFVRFAIQDRLGRKDCSLLEICWNLMDAMRKGHKLAEVTYDVIEEGQYKGKFGVASIRPKPRENYAFVVDQNNTFRGVIAKIPGASLVIRVGMVGDASELPGVIAPEKLLILRLDSQDNDPRGKSWFRGVYDPWYRKNALKPEHLKTGIQFGGGMIMAVLPENAAQQKGFDPTTNTTVPIGQAILNALAQLRNGGLGVFPSGTDITVHVPHADVKFFTDSFSYADIEMATSVLLSATAILEARHSSKASSGQGQDLLDEVKTHCRDRICEMLTNKLAYPLVQMNFGDEIANKYTPKLVMQRTSTPDFAANATAIAALQTSGYLDPSQLKSTDVRILGLPPRLDQNQVEAASDIEEDNNAEFSAGTFRPESDGRRFWGDLANREAEIAIAQQSASTWENQRKHMG